MYKRCTRKKNKSPKINQTALSGSIHTRNTLPWLRDTTKAQWLNQKPGLWFGSMLGKNCQGSYFGYTLELSIVLPCNGTMLGMNA